MKNLKLISILGAVALLSACSLGGDVEARAPKFATMGDTVSYSDIMVTYNRLGQASELYKEEKLGDRTLKAYTADVNSLTIKRNNKEIRKEEYKQIISLESSFDYGNLVSKTVTNMTTTQKQSNQKATGSNKYVSKEEQYRQFGVALDQDAFLQVDAKTKEYFTVENITVDADQEAIFDSYLKDSLGGLNSEFISNLVDDKNYEYHINDTVLTYLYNIDRSNNYKSNNVTTHNEHTITKFKAQIDLQDGKQAVRISHEQTVETTYYEDYLPDNAHKGDVNTSKETRYVEYTISNKNVTNRPINIKDYTYAGTYQ